MWIFYAINQRNGKLQDDNIFAFIVSFFLYSGILKSLAEGYIQGKLFNIKKEELPEIFYLFLLVIFILATCLLAMAVKETFFF